MLAVHRLLGAATDHYHAFARLLRMEEPYAPSLAALLRSFGEVMGRAWWLLESKSPEQLVHRDAALRLKEHHQAGRTPIGSRGSDGVLRIMEDPINEAQRRLAQVQIAGVKETVPDYSTLFERVCEAAGVEKGRELYSQLSGAAHGSSLMIGALTHIGAQNEDGSAPTMLGLSIQFTERYLDALVRITELTVRRLAEAYEARDELERLD